MGTKKTVAVTSTSFSNDPSLLNELSQLDLTIVANTKGVKFDESALADFLSSAHAEVAIIGLEKVDGALLDQCPHLRFIAKYGVGLDNIDQDALKVRNIGLGWTGGVNKRSVSELALAFMLGHMRNVIPSIMQMRSGNWQKIGGRQLSHATIGIVGLGHVGFDLAQLLVPFGSRVLYTDLLDCAAKVGQLPLESVSYSELLAQSDVISFHVPLSPKTRMMFGRKEIAVCRKSALIINTSRGEIVDFPAVCGAVKGGDLGGFGCDVFAEEPSNLQEWTNEPRLYFTPHIGGNAKEAVLAMGRSAIGHVADYFSGTMK